MKLRWVSASVAAAAVAAGLGSALAVAAAPAPETPKANPCKDVKNCKVIPGPWVAVPASGEAVFLLECPKRAGTIGGIDALASSTDVRVVWEGNTGSPVRPGTTTIYFAFFHAASAKGKPGLFQPYIGCIPAQKITPRSILSARITRPGDFLDRRQTLVDVKAGKQTAFTACKKKERVVSGWHAVVFGADTPPDPALASKVHVTLAIVGGKGGKVVVSVQTDKGMPASAHAQVQVGAVCAT